MTLYAILFSWTWIHMSGNIIAMLPMPYKKIVIIKIWLVAEKFSFLSSFSVIIFASPCSFSSLFVVLFFSYIKAEIWYNAMRARVACVQKCRKAQKENMSLNTKRCHAEFSLCPDLMPLFSSFIYMNHAVCFPCPPFHLTDMFFHVPSPHYYRDREMTETRHYYRIAFHYCLSVVILFSSLFTFFFSFLFSSFFFSFLFQLDEREEVTLPAVFGWRILRFFIIASGAAFLVAFI